MGLQGLGNRAPGATAHVGSLDIIWESVNSQWDIRYTPDLDDTVVTVHARFDEQIPERSQENSKEIDNHLAPEVLEMAENIGDYMYLVELKHYVKHIPYITTRVVERKGLIAAYRKLARKEYTTESGLQSK